jgi:hypothetical protein
LLEHCARRLERLGGKAEVARDQRDLGFGDHASRAGHSLSRSERTRRGAEERFGANQIAELRHSDAAQRERWRIVAQRNPLQGTERITSRKRAGRGRDQRVHVNPATLVTLTI